MAAEPVGAMQVFDIISSGEWSRMLALFIHLMVAAVTLCVVFLADIKVVTGRFTRAGIRHTAQNTALLLVALWASGLVVIYLDTGFDLAVLAGKSKLLFKLVCVLALTANGFVLHRFSLSIITGYGDPTKFQMFILAVTGSISTSHWLLAAFIGVSRPLGRLPVDVLLYGYVVVVAIALFSGLALAPMLHRRLLDWRQRNGVDIELPLSPPPNLDPVASRPVKRRATARSC